MALASPVTGIFLLADTVQRQLPSAPGDPITHESIHSSVLRQSSLSPLLSGLLALHPTIVSPLLPLEEEMKAKWSYDSCSPAALAYQKQLKDHPESSDYSNRKLVTELAVQEVQINPFRLLWGQFFRVLWSALRRKF